MKFRFLLLAALAIPMAACTTPATDTSSSVDATSSSADCAPGDPGYPDCKTGVPEIIE